MNTLNSKFLGPSIRSRSSPDTYYIIKDSKIITSNGMKTLEMTGYLYLGSYVSFGLNKQFNKNNIMRETTYTKMMDITKFDPKVSYRLTQEMYVDFCQLHPEKSEMFLKVHLFNSTSKLITIQSAKILTIGPGSILKVVGRSGSTKVLNAAGSKEFPNMSFDFLYMQDQYTRSKSEYNKGRFPSHLLTIFTDQINKERKVRYAYRIMALFMSNTFKALISRGAAISKLPFNAVDIRPGPFFAFQSLVSRWASRFAYNFGFQKALIEGLIMDLGTILVKLFFYPHMVYCVETEAVNKVLENGLVNIGSYHKFIQQLLYEIYTYTYKSNFSYITLDETDGITNRISDKLRNLLIKSKKLNVDIPDLIILSNNRITLKTIALTEMYVTKYLSKPVQTKHIDLSEINSSDLSKTQKDVARRVIKGKSHAVITGAAGTGKTKLLTNIVSIYLKNSYNIRILAPTGCAIANVRKATKDEQEVGLMTHIIHQYILSNNIQPKRKYNGMSVIIIDEVSMVSVSLFARLTRTAPERTKFIFIGDANQLPSIEGDSIIRFIKDDGNLKIPIYALKEIFRSKTNSSLMNLSTKIANMISTRVYEPLVKSDFNETNVILRNESSLEVMFKQVVLVYNRFLMSAREKIDQVNESKGVDIKSKEYKSRSEDIIHSYAKKQIMVLAPYRASVKRLNELLQSKLIKDKSNFVDTMYSGIFYKGDYVRCTANMTYYIEATPEEIQAQRDNGVKRPKKRLMKSLHNGQRGIINEIADTHIMIKFNGKKCVKFYLTDRRDRPTISMLTLAYALTIHNSQGSQANTVFVYIPTANERTTFIYNGLTMDMFMHNQMLYVAITRTQRTLIIYSKLSVINEIINKFVPPTRFLRDFKRSIAMPHIQGEELEKDSELEYIDRRKALISNVFNSHITIANQSSKLKISPLSVSDFSLLKKSLSTTSIAEPTVAEQMEEVQGLEEIEEDEEYEF